MRVALITAPGVPDNLVVEERPEPVATAGEVLIDVAYCGCNFADTMLRRGTYPHKLAYPLIPGFEIAGRVLALGQGVAGFAVGDRVGAFVEPGGGYAERCVADVRRVFHLPDEVSFAVAAGFPIQGMTAWHMLHTLGQVQKGQTVLIHAIGGGVGLFLTQIAVHAGARVIGTVGSAPKAERPLAYGAERVVVRGEEDFTKAVLEFAGEDGVDLVLDSLGAETLDRSFGVVKKLGHVISYGEAEGRPYANLWERIVPRSLTFTRFHVGHIAHGAEVQHRCIAALLDGIRAGWLKVPIEGVFPLHEAAAMHDRLESRTVAGKLVLEVQKLA